MNIGALYQHYQKSNKVSTDTRNIEPGAVFFALKGPNFNANLYAADALDKGAALVVVDELHHQKRLGDRYVLVDDVLKALQALARHHRQQLNIPVIGITGSNGKTTTKELIAKVLGQKYRVFATKGNLNNHIGVPLTLLSIDDTVEIAIVEMGANRVGDIAELCAIALPDHGMITNIGMAHVGYFGGFENIVRGKSELYHHLIQHDGVVWINSQNEILHNMAKRFKAPMFYPAAGDYLSCEFVGASPYVIYKDETGKKTETQLVGGYNFENIAAALCIGKFFGVDASAANEAVASYAPDNNRSQVIKKGTNTIILDAYNANPTSMASAIENMAAMDGEHKILILGDMYELGDESHQAHAQLGVLAKEKGFAHLLLCGKLIKPALDEHPNAKYFEAKEELADFLVKEGPKDALILLKASRGIGLETLVDVL